MVWATFVIAMVVAVIVGVLIVRVVDGSWKNTWTGLAGIPAGALIALLFCMIGALFTNPTYGPSCYNVELVALGAGDNIHGSFFLGSGQIRNQPVFQYYYKYGNQIRFSWVPSDNEEYSGYEVSVIEEEVEVPNLQVCPPDYFGFGKWVFARMESDPAIYTFHVPPGSVDRTIHLGLP